MARVFTYALIRECEETFFSPYGIAGQTPNLGRPTRPPYHQARGLSGITLCTWCNAAPYFLPFRQSTVRGSHVRDPRTIHGTVHIPLSWGDRSHQQHTPSAGQSTNPKPGHLSSSCWCRPGRDRRSSIDRNRPSRKTNNRSIAGGGSFGHVHDGARSGTLTLCTYPHRVNAPTGGA